MESGDRADSTKQRQTAIHESAHVIVTASQFFQQGAGERIEGGIFLTLASVVPTETTWGSMNLWEKCDSQITLGAINMAGAVADVAHTGSMRNILYGARGDAEFVAQRLGISEGDILHAWGYLLSSEDSPYENLEWYGVLKDSFVLCTKIISARWHAILSLANHLLDVREMGVRAIQEYLSEHQICAREWNNE